MWNLKSRSQAWQDFFAYSIGGAQGTYIEIGANGPVGKNNTYNLETQFGYRGFSIELDESHKPNWDKHSVERKNKIYWGSALDLDYAQAIKDQALPSHITYLSCDIEPPENTFAALKRVINAGISFDCITFEHDKFRRNSGNYDELAQEFLAAHGYKVAVYDVYSKNPARIFETWFVKNSIKFEPISFADWQVAQGLV